MVVIDQTKEKGRIILLDEEIVGNANPFTKIDRTANGGVLFKSMQYDEFDNQSILTIELTGIEIQTIKRLFDEGLI